MGAHGSSWEKLWEIAPWAPSALVVPTAPTLEGIRTSRPRRLPAAARCTRQSPAPALVKARSAIKSDQKRSEAIRSDQKRSEAIRSALEELLLGEARARERGNPRLRDGRDDALWYGRVVRLLPLDHWQAARACRAWLREAVDRSHLLLGLAPLRDAVERGGRQVRLAAQRFKRLLRWRLRCSAGGSSGGYGRRFTCALGERPSRSEEGGCRYWPL